MNRILLIAYAVALLILVQYGFIQWRSSGHSLAEAWLTLRQDWLVFIVFVDATQFTLLVLGWLSVDLRRQRRPTWEKVFWFGLTLWLGVPGLVLYTVWRREPRFNPFRYGTK